MAGSASSITATGVICTGAALTFAAFFLMRGFGSVFTRALSVDLRGIEGNSVAKNLNRDLARTI
jgi:hypothetical protein